MDSFGSTNGNKGKWKEEEDAKPLWRAVRNSTDGIAIAALVPGRTDKQCRNDGLLDPCQWEQGVNGKKRTQKLVEAVESYSNSGVTNCCAGSQSNRFSVVSDGL
jgi:hypothetical protein